jgi:hypothetical protein
MLEAQKEMLVAFEGVAGVAQIIAPAQALHK